MPPLPIVLDSIKADFLKQKKERESNEKSTEESKELTQYDLFKRLIKTNPEPLDYVLEKPPADQSPFTQHREARAVILSIMGVEARTAEYKLNKKGTKKLENDEILEFFKVPFAVALREDFFITLRNLLQESIVAVNSGKRHTPLELFELLNLL